MLRSFGPIRLSPLYTGALSLRRPTLWVIAAGALLVRLYLASLWFRFGVAKLETDWLTTNPVRALLTVVAGGQTPMPIPGLAVVADALLAIHADVALSVLLPLTEVALAAAFLTGWCVRLAAATGIAINASLILGGLASVSFDGRIILLQSLLLLVGARAGALGLAAIVRAARTASRAASSFADRSTTGPQPRRRAA